MFAVRGLAVSASVFVMVYCVLSLAVCLTWRRLRLWHGHYHAQRMPDLLFALRMFPLAAAALATAVFTVPSFLLFEPRTIVEPVGEIARILGVCSATFLLLGLANAGLSILRASRTISRWTRVAQPLGSFSAIPVIQIVKSAPAMVATGIIHPKILLGGATRSLLTREELEIALKHESAHVRRRDNLKKLLLTLAAFPGMAGLEAAWLEATELAADDVAVSNADQALDLASALIKISQHRSVEAPAHLSTALIHGPASVMNARIQRLISWSAKDRLPSAQRSPRFGLAGIVYAGLAFAISYGYLLHGVHAATEWLVR